MRNDEVIGIYILVIFLYFLLNGLLASNASNIAMEKGYEKRKWFHMCFWLGPLAYVIISAMPDKVLRENQQQTNILLGELLNTKGIMSEQVSEKKEKTGEQVGKEGVNTGEDVSSYLPDI